VNPSLDFAWYINLIQELREQHPTIDLDCFSPIEIEGIAEVTNLSSNEVLSQLKSAGMHGLPGGGAEILVETVRSDVSPKKGHPDNWLRVMKEAQLLGLTTSATNVIGFGETNHDRIQHLNRIRQQQDEVHQEGFPGFTSFIAWPVQLETNTFGKRNRGQNRFERGAGSTEYLRHVAISRLFLDNVGHIQASWPTMGMGVAQMALLAGADDAGSTMMEENVVSASGTTKFSATEYELQLSITRAGFMPVRRNSDYDRLDTPNALENAPDVNCQPPSQIVELV
ncbi:MAG: dehypoxanthine futalosine cyclase, partial [Candidatus Thermoplasmatota archaeon]|nr:dehypoxanthine futalosine cyclase [Candidatus Thermoplasmatota archaeon]